MENNMPETFEQSSVPQTAPAERYAPEAFIPALAINVQRDYYEAKQLATDEQVMQWIIGNSENFRRAFNLIMRDILADEHYADAVDQARHGDDLVLREIIVRWLSQLLDEQE